MLRLRSAATPPEPDHEFLQVLSDGIYPGVDVHSLHLRRYQAHRDSKPPCQCYRFLDGRPLSAGLR